MITTHTPKGLPTGHGYAFTPTTGGYDIWIDGAWAGWSAGTLTDARDTARDILRIRAERAEAR